MAASPSSAWDLDPGVDFLNHGSFGACPRRVLGAQALLREQMERRPVHFFERERETLVDAALERLGGFVGADAADLAFVTNATTGVNAVLRSLQFEAGDEILVTDHAYNACRNAVEYVAARSGARVVVARIPFPIESSAAATDAILGAVSPATRLAVIDHVTSPTALVLPIADIVHGMRSRGVETLVDGAHAPGMVPLDLDALGAGYYAANCHKWLCAPKGAGFLHVRRELQGGVVPPVISLGANSGRTDKSRFRLLFDWVGTTDVTAYLSVPAALDVIASLHPEGWSGVMADNRAKALAARDLLCDTLGLAPPAPDVMLGSMAAFPLRAPGTGATTSAASTGFDADRRDPLQTRLLTEDRIEVPVNHWPAPGRRVLRISAQLYNTPAQYQRLAGALRAASGI